jgi:hypothetical protein
MLRRDGGPYRDAHKTPCCTSDIATATGDGRSIAGVHACSI